jgi:predicted hydrolase (HD superfamily)
MTHAILCHNPIHGIPPQTKLDKALFCADPLANLIVDLAKDRKLTSLKAETVIKEFKQENFATEADGQQISQCSEIGIEFNKFIRLGLKAMQSINANLGL